MAPICGKITLPKEYIKTQKVTNAPHLISQSELPQPKEIILDKIRTYLSIFSGETGASIIAEKHIPRKKMNIK